MADQKQTRREFIKGIAYIPPIILTLAAVPAFASRGSNRRTTKSSYSKKYKKYYGEHKNYGQMMKYLNKHKNKGDD